MAERAVELGPIIGVAAALESTLGPTQELLRQVAAERGLAVDLRVIRCAEAWEHKKRGDEAAYISAVVDCLEASADGCDVIVLAQGSMAAAADRVSLEPPILSSPRLGVKRVADMMGANN